MKQYGKQHEEQECFNVNVMKQLGYLIDKIKCFLKLASLAVPTNHPSPGNGSS